MHGNGITDKTSTVVVVVWPLAGGDRLSGELVRGDAEKEVSAGRPVGDSQAAAACRRRGSQRTRPLTVTWTLVLSDVVNAAKEYNSSRVKEKETKTKPNLSSPIAAMTKGRKQGRDRDERRTRLFDSSIPSSVHILFNFFGSPISLRAARECGRSLWKHAVALQNRRGCHAGRPPSARSLPRRIGETKASWPAGARWRKRAMRGDGRREGKATARRVIGRARRAIAARRGCVRKYLRAFFPLKQVGKLAIKGRGGRRRPCGNNLQPTGPSSPATAEAVAGAPEGRGN